jgi:hypothetical protein
MASIPLNINLQNSLRFLDSGKIQPMPMMAMGVLGVQGVCVWDLGVIYENNYSMVAGLKYILLYIWQI